MRFTKGSICEIKLTPKVWETLVIHCRRKLNKNYIPGETKDLKAYGLLAGSLDKNILTIKAIAPLLKNARGIEGHKPYMDEMMDKHAIPSETPLNKRGWVADPDELQDVLAGFREKVFQLAGSYHMHRVAWDHDKERETPTELDTILGENSRMFMFIISMVNPDKPTIRAFFEGNNDLEVQVIVL